MDITHFHTRQTGQATGNPAQIKALAAGSGIMGIAPGMSFMDMLFARLTIEDGEAHAEKTAVTLRDKASAQKDKHALIESLMNKAAPDETDQALLASLATQLAIETGIDPEAIELTDSGSIRDMIRDILEQHPELAEKLVVTTKTPADSISKASAEKRYGDILKSLLKGIPEKTSAPDGNNILIASGLSIEEITDILERLAKDAPDDGMLMAGLVKIMPPPSGKDILFVPRGVVAIDKSPAKQSSSLLSGQDSKSSGDKNMAMRLNDLVIGNAGASDEGNVFFEEGDFDGVLRVLERAQGKAMEQTLPGTGERRDIMPPATAGNSAMTALPVAASDGLSLAFALADIFPDGFDMASFSAAQGSQPLSQSIAQLTSVMAHAAHATAPHPATQSVAATISKAAQSGEQRNITLHLEPPELGRVRIVMSFGGDKTLKAHMLVERPETYLMLQRDAQTLERTLQDAGLDAEGGLSFELADDGHLFDHGQKDQNGHAGGGDHADKDDADDTEIIETTMNWFVDPESGLTRYDLLV